MSKEEQAVIEHYEAVKKAANAHGWHLWVKSGVWHLGPDRSSPAFYSSSTLTGIIGFIYGYDHLAERDEHWPDAMEKLKEAAATLIRAINGPAPRPNIDESIDALEELL